MRRSARIAALPSNSTSTSTSTKPNRKRKAEKVIVPIKQLHFDGPFRRQNLPFRDSFINYITKSPSNAKAWQKLIQSCKYFFAKNPILVIEELCITSDSKLKLSMNGFENSFDIAKFSFLELLHQIISFDKFLFLSSNVEDIYLHQTIVENENGSMVPLEKIVHILPKIKECWFVYNPTSFPITSNTIKELLEIPHFSKINRIVIRGLTETFDIETFFGYLKENKHTSFQLFFYPTISQPFKICLEKIIDEIIEAKTHNYKPPLIDFSDLAIDKKSKIQKIFNQS